MGLVVHVWFHITFPMNNTHLVFVYGTLQRGCSNHILLDRARFLGQAVTEENFVMRTLVDASGRRGIPFVGRDVPLGPVHGEVYAVDDRTLVELDRLEGCVPDDPAGSWYRREKVPVCLTSDAQADGERACSMEAFIYLHERPASPLVASGRWKDAVHLDAPCFYFAYGSNMDPHRMLDRGVPFDQCMTARLPDHSLAFNKSGNGGTEAYANAQPRRGEDLPGILYRVPSAAIQDRLDGFEGVSAGHYHRVQMKVLAGPLHARADLAAARPVVAWVYLAGTEYVREGLPVTERYLHYIRRGQRLFGLVPGGAESRS